MKRTEQTLGGKLKVSEIGGRKMSEGNTGDRGGRAREAGVRIRKGAQRSSLWGQDVKGRRETKVFPWDSVSLG